MSLDPDFDRTILCLLDRGVVFATAHVRGGGELGKEWTEQGRQFNVKNRFLDFEAAADTLVALGISEKSRLVAWGESSGGLTVGATANTRPDLFKALLLEVPFLDVLNTMSDPKIPLTCGDWAETGNSNEVDYFHYIMEYSPYENIRMQAYPAILCTVSLNDAMVGFWESLKYLAKLRRTKLDDNLAMVKVNFHAGHMHSSDRYDYLRERAFYFAYVLDQLGIAA
jgi:oligopeptidase B